MHTVLLVFDIGTSGLKASLVDAHLNILRNVTTTYPTHHRPDGRVEQDAADWWMSAVRAMLMLRELVPEYLKQVDAIGISGQMLGLLPMDGEGQTLRPAIIRRDTRAKAVTETLLDRFGADYFYRISGNVLTPNLTLSKAVWLHENEPEV
ncbi:MAG: FGGY family carbohydrate kinase, partial [Clostridiales bacterium]|nr:FGGY family carbohydrate kinase [Clostridiales bacterium]MDD7487105.1 FGGY family carbohydrate kinase [Clostridiales bacterium]